MTKPARLTKPQQRVVDALRAMPMERAEGVTWHALVDAVRDRMNASGEAGYMLHDGTVANLTARGLVVVSQVPDEFGTTAYFRLAEGR